MKKETTKNQEEQEQKIEDCNTGAANNENDLETINDGDKVEELGKKLAEINDKYLRLYSDFENFRKRTSKEKLDMIVFASEEIIKSLLPVVDDYERALDDLNKQESIPESTKEGMLLIYNKLIYLLTSKGVKTIEAKGEKFDENYHEAITQFPAQDESQKGLIIDVVEKGYMMSDKVIRFSKVVVAI